MSVVGIDLGTTSSSAAIFRNGSVELLEVEQSNKVMPSCVAFAGKERLVGQRALAQLVDNPQNTICDVKAMIGLTYEEAQQQRNWDFDLEKAALKPKILVQCGESQKTFYPEEISSMILSRIWENTKKNLGEEPKGAVITVPASFNHAQRKATMDAAHIAGVRVLELINEPTAAALAYQHQNPTKTQTKMLILHFGGGSFNVSVMTCDKGNLKVVGSIGSSHLGGMNFDDQLFKYFTHKHLGEEICDARKKRVPACKLRLACETAKKNLSAAVHARVEIKALRDGKDFQSTLNRQQFLQINERIFMAIKDSVKMVLKEANVTVSQINDVVTIGNSTRLSFIEDILTKDCGFDRRKIRKTIKPDEAAVVGAALRAAMFTENQNRQGNNLKRIQDILSNDIYTVGVDGSFLPVFSHGVNIPSEVEIRLAKEKDDFALEFYSHGMAIVNKTFKWKEECRSMTVMNVLCNECKVNKFKANINSGGLFEISVSPKYGLFKRVESCGLHAAEIEKLIEDRKKYCSEDEDIRRIKNDLYELEREVYETQDKYGCDLSDIVEWIKNNPVPSSCDRREKWKELENIQQGKGKHYCETKVTEEELKLPFKSKLSNQGKVNHYCETEAPEEELKLPFKSKVFNEKLRMKLRELFQELEILDSASEPQTPLKVKSQSNADRNAGTNLQKFKSRPGVAKLSQAVNNAFWRGDGVEARQKYEASQNKKTAISQNTAKLDRETEEKKRASKKRVGSEQSQNIQDSFQPNLIFLKRAREEINKLQETNAVIWRKRIQIIEIITEKPLASTIHEKKENPFTTPTKENRLVMELLDLFKALGIITEIQMPPGGEIQDKSIWRNGADCGQEEKMDRSFEEKFSNLLKKALAEIRRLRIENDTFRRFYKETAEKLQNYPQMPPLAWREKDPPTVSKAPQEGTKEMQDKYKIKYKD